MPRDVARANGWSRDALAAYYEAVRRYAGMIWVTGVTIGLKEVNGDVDIAAGPVIAIHVRKKEQLAKIPRRRRVPRILLGVPTDVIEGTYVRSGNGAGSMSPAFPLRPGSSYARRDGSAATLAGVVEDGAGIRYLLSSAHTLREGGHVDPGALMVHPGPADSQQPVGVARYERTHLGTDSGIARLEPGIQVVNRALISNRMILAPQPAQQFDVLEKSGEATKLTRGQVRQFGIFGNVDGMRLVLPDADPVPISKGGDSGSTWYDTTTFAAKGLHHGIDLGSNGRVAIAALMSTVLKKLRVTWV
ncbi:MAG: hypothetical protein QOI24_2981 [Acidobacteriota bacterium]|jgi:hypothetical protein|nr:hypothetical protein [Acidobacteriota bacterium]